MRTIPLLLLLLISGCLSANPTVQQVGTSQVTTDTLWQGTVVVSGVITVERDATLTVAPGTRILFKRTDADRDGLGDASLVIKGSLRAIGSEARPIVFASAEKSPTTGDWLEIRSDFARQLLFDWCEIRDSAYTIHAHFTRGHLRNSHIHHNIDGSRLGRSNFRVEHNLIEFNQGKGINFRDSNIRLEANIIRNNGTGIFLFEKPGESIITHNNIYANDINLRLGDFFSDNVSLADNWWGTADQAGIEKLIYDRKFDAEIGIVSLNPAQRWHVIAGIQRTAVLTADWTYPTEGYIDADINIVAGVSYAASWDHSVSALSPDGRLLWKTRVDDVVDANLAFDTGFLYLQDWSRTVSRLRLADGEREILFTYPPSESDDHRQSGLAVVDDLLLVGAWNGTLYGVNLANSAQHWEFDAGMSLRARPVVGQGKIFVGSGDGILSALDLSGALLWQKTLHAPLLSSPVLGLQRLYLVDKSGHLVSLDENGRILWDFELGELCFYGSPQLGNNELFVATAGGGLWKFDTDSGQPVWRVDLPGPTYSSPTLAGAVLIVGDNSGALTLFDKDSGKQLSRIELPAEIQTTPSLLNNRVFIGSRDHSVHVFRLLSPAPVDDAIDGKR